MGSRFGLLALVLATALMSSGLPSRAADEPVATAPIPPPPRDQPAVVPLHSPPPVGALAKPAPKTAAKPERATPSQERKRTETNHKKPAVHNAATESGKSSKQRPAEPGKHAEKRKSHSPGTEPYSARREAAASRDQLRPPSDYGPRRYYREEIVGPPFPPPWSYRGPPFAAMPYPRGPMPPW